VYSICIKIEPWDKPGGESVSKFRRRFDAACKLERENHIQQIQEEGWTAKGKIGRSEYIEGLAMWQAGLRLDKIRRHMAEQGVHIGTDRDLSPLVHGINNVAQMIEIDRRA
jgi:hypothetical protein